jgi:Zn-dependent metalloprotease
MSFRKGHENLQKKHRHNCFCSYVPPQVLENLARSGIKEAVFSINQSKISREKRDQKDIKTDNFMMEFTSYESVGKAARYIYDSKNSWMQRVGNPVRKEGVKAGSDKTVNLVYDFVGDVREYFKKMHDRKSIDDANMDLILNVHYGEKYQNAFWDGDEMTFGDGDGEIFVDFAKSLDVIAHELTHGVVQWEANLEYKGQSGALNEHFADVFGTVITQWVDKQTAKNADWLIGDEIMGPKLTGEALRSMIEPGTAYDNDLMGKDPQPSHMEFYYSGSDDNYGVHINSGIPNKVFYLVAKEMEIGTKDASMIWYDALKNLWPTANFNDAVKVIVRSAQTLTEKKIVPKGSPQKVRAAFKEVGLPTT